LKAKKETQSYSQETKYTYYTSLYKNQNYFNKKYDEVEIEFYSRLSERIKYNPKIVKRIYAERNISPEIETSIMEVSGYGTGVTSVLNNVLNKSKYDENLVKVELLNKLNEIMGQDAHFTEIVTQQIEDSTTTKWEVFLREENKGRIALSQSGSGLKTVLMVLVFTILLPKIEENKKLNDYVFLFEELENNLHPSLERRLLKYLEELTKEGSVIFLSTHSNTVLDIFQNNNNVQIYNVIKETDSIKIRILDSILGKHNCLDDLGLKASDILQSNGIIWVEGPSDRVYINKWIQLWSSGKYKEGFDYTCVFYGGRLLSNVTFDHESIDDLVKLMLINKNSIVVIDSDRKNKSSKINKTKNRIREEFKKNNQYCMISQGREIENYIPIDLILKHYQSKKVCKFQKFDDFKEILDFIKEDEGKRFIRSKIEYAQKFIQHMTLSSMENSLDLDFNMNKIIDQIKSWNSK